MTVLIVVWFLHSSLSTIGGVTMQEFGSKEKCDAARQVVMQTLSVVATCVEK